MTSFSFKTDSMKMFENSQVYSKGTQTKFFVINFTVSGLLGIPFCPWKNELQSQPETLRWKHMQMYKNEPALTGKVITKPKSSLCYLDTLRLDSFTRNRQCWSASVILEPSCVWFSRFFACLPSAWDFFFFWPLFWSFQYQQESRRSKKRWYHNSPVFF